MKAPVALRTWLGAASLALPLMAAAESNVQTGAGVLGAHAHVDLRIVIPQILYLRVGTGSNYTTGVLANNAAKDLIQFAPTAAQVGNGVAVAGTGGNLAGGAETAAIIGNGGNVTLKATSTGALLDAAGASIAFTQVKTAATAAFYPTLLPAPVLQNGASANIVITAPASNVIRADAKWTYTYANTNVPAAGTYGGVNIRNSRVLYTATMP
jgi:hypothetical protein